MPSLQTHHRLSLPTSSTRAQIPIIRKTKIQGRRSASGIIVRSHPTGLSMGLTHSRTLTVSLGALVLGHDSLLSVWEGSFPSSSKPRQFRTSISLSPIRRKASRTCLATGPEAIKCACEHCFNRSENSTLRSWEALKTSDFEIKG